MTMPLRISAARTPTLTRMRRDQVAVLAALAVITAAAWIYTVGQADQMAMRGMGGHGMVNTMHAMLTMQPWTLSEFSLRLAMWGVMMVAMMVPTAAPMTLVYAAVARKAAAQQSPLPPTFVFVAGYITVWGLFGVYPYRCEECLSRSLQTRPRGLPHRGKRPEEKKRAWLRTRRELLLYSGGIIGFLLFLFYMIRDTGPKPDQP